MILFKHPLKNTSYGQRIDFSGGPTILTSTQLKYPALYGWSFSNEQGDQKSIIMNLSSLQLNSEFSGIFPKGIKFKQLKGHPKNLVTDLKTLEETQGQISKEISLPAYSVTLLKHDD